MQAFTGPIHLARWASLAILIAAIGAPPISATPGSGFAGTQIAKGLYGPLDIKSDKTGKWDLFLKTKADSDVYVTRNAIAVDGQSGWHTHPGPSLVTVTVGEVTVYDGEDPLCTSKVYQAGDGIIDIGGDELHLIRNESGAPAETVAVQFLPVGAERRLDRPKPTNCPF